MAGRPYLVKLVRDGVGKFLGPQGAPVYQPLPPEEHVKRLREKLVHEALEYLQDPSVGELADVLECVEALAKVDLHVPLRTILRAGVEKRQERGGLEQGMGMYIETLHPTDGEELAEPTGFPGYPEGLSDDAKRFAIQEWRRGYAQGKQQ